MTALDWEQPLGQLRRKSPLAAPFSADFQLAAGAFCDWLWDQGLTEEAGCFRALLAVDKWPFWTTKEWMFWCDDDAFHRRPTEIWHSELGVLTHERALVKEPTLLAWLEQARRVPKLKELMQCAS